MSAMEIDSRKWTGDSFSKEGDDWLPEEIVPRLQRRAIYIDHARYSILPALIILGFFLFAVAKAPPIFEIFGVTVLDLPQILFIFCGLPFFYILDRYLKHIKKYKSREPFVKFNKEGILCRETSQFFNWNEVNEITAYPKLSSSSRMLLSREIVVRVAPENKDQTSSIGTEQESYSWRLDGTDTDPFWIARCAKRWRELAHEQKDAQDNAIAATER